MAEAIPPNYELVMGSDVADRDGMYLELNDGAMETAPLAEVFYSDVDGSMVVSTFGNTLPLDVIESLIAEAKRRLPPAQQPDGLADQLIEL